MLLPALIGAALILLGEGLSLVYILPWSRYVFPLFWYGYILVLDSLNFRLYGRSLITGRPAEFCLMLPISAFYWYLFEWYNLAIQNWLYINIPPETWIAVTVKIVSFATVIPAVYETAGLLGDSPRPGNGVETRAPAPPWGRRLSVPCFILGVFFSILPFIFPRLFFWSVWLGLLFVLDPINDWAGRPSLLHDWQEGKLHTTIVFLLAGYICGLFWEFWNYWAYTKWIYTVPIPPMPHIFEMPILGFLGFGPFGLETFAFWTLIRGAKGPQSPE